MSTTFERFLEMVKFRMFGRVGKTLRIEDEKTKKVTRFVGIVGAGKTFNMEVDTDDELKGYERAEGRWVRAYGVLGRRRGSAAGVARIEDFKDESSSDWKPPKEKEVIDGCIFTGVGKVVSKRSGDGAAGPYRRVQVMTFGETFEFDVTDKIYDSMPETGFIAFEGHTEPSLKWSQSGKVADMDLILDAVTPQAEESAPSGRPPGTAGQPTGAKAG